APRLPGRTGAIARSAASPPAAGGPRGAPRRARPQPRPSVGPPPRPARCAALPPPAPPTPPPRRPPPAAGAAPRATRTSAACSPLAPHHLHAPVLPRGHLLPARALRRERPSVDRAHLLSKRLVPVSG